jgi:hypothetical protein
MLYDRPMAAAVISSERVRQYRERKRHGLVQLTVTVDEVALTEALANKTPYLQSLDPAHGDISAALEKLIQFWIEAEK